MVMSSPRLFVTYAFMVPVFAGTTLLSPNADNARTAITSHRERACIACLLFSLY